MDLKGILKDCLVQGVNQFFDSAISQMEQESERIIEEELSRHEMMLEEMQCTLEGIGASGKFDKNLKDKEDLWLQAMVTAILLSGRSKEELGIEEDANNFNELQAQWRATVYWVDSTLRKILDRKAEIPFMTNVRLEDACNTFYDEISQLRNFSGGLFSTRKLKKEISYYSGKFSAVCTGNILNIQMLRKLNEESSS